MRPRKNSGAKRAGIEFTGNPDVKDRCKEEAEKESRGARRF